MIYIDLTKHYQFSKKDGTFFLIVRLSR